MVTHPVTKQAITMTEQQLWDRLSRSPDLTRSMIEQLVRLTILIIGCGAVGSATALHLSGCHIGRLHLIDGDTVTEANIPHSPLFCLRDVGKRKVTVTAAFLRRKFPALTVTTTPRFIQHCKEAVYDTTDLIICAPDNDQTRLWVNYYAVMYQKPALFVGLGGPGDEWSGYLYFYLPGQSGCFSCFHQSEKAADHLSLPVPHTNDLEADRLQCGGKNIEVPVLAPVVGLTASFAAALVVKHLLGLPVPIYTSLNAKVPLLTSLPIQPVPTCAVCGTKEEYDIETVLAPRRKQIIQTQTSPVSERRQTP